jgi:hypothetical protein
VTQNILVFSGFTGAGEIPTELPLTDEGQVLVGGSVPMEPFAYELYQGLEPLHFGESTHGYALAYYCRAIGLMFDYIDKLARQYEWESIMDPNEVPREGIRWLGQFVGVQIDHGTPEGQMRAKLLDRSGWYRGTPLAIANAAAATLTGTRSVILLERYGGNAWHLRVLTRTGETPVPAATLDAVLNVKPAGIILEHQVVDTLTYDLLAAQHASYNAVQAAFTDYADIADEAP